MARIPAKQASPAEPGPRKLESSRRENMDRFERSAQDGTHQQGEFSMQMSGQGLIVILFVGLVAGWLAGKIVRGTGFGIIGDIIVGILGAFIAGWLFPRLGFHLGVGLVEEILFSAIGAIVLLLIVRLIRTGGRF
jgi:uncharacterized membrane protein YeaQ/YmgE (transglycosylase-associated protein family)